MPIVRLSLRQVFLSMNVTVDVPGSVWFNYSMDMTAGPGSRVFFFYIDDDIVDYVQACNYYLVCIHMRLCLLICVCIHRDYVQACNCYLVYMCNIL